MSLETEFHTELETRAAEWVTLHEWRYTTNFRLPNAKIADIFGITPAREIFVIEVKTALNHSLMQQAWDKYHDYCNRLYIAAPKDDIEGLLAQPAAYAWPDIGKKLGMLALTDRTAKLETTCPFRIIPPVICDYLKWKLDELLDIPNKYYTRRSPGPATV